MLRGRVMETVPEGVTVYIDQNRSYLGFVKKNYRHEATNHGMGKYIRGKAQVQGACFLI